MSVFARFQTSQTTAYGLVTGETIEELEGGLLDPPVSTGRSFPLNAVKLLAPCQPSKILAVGRNFASHLEGRPCPVNPELFYKPITCLQDPGGPIVKPADSEDLSYEGELVVVIGKTLRHASLEEAASAVFGVTCGNDVSERNWQRGAGKDIQWWRAKGCDTFGPLGPVVVTGLNYSDLLLTTRLNGKVVQQQRTADLIFDIPTVLSFASRYVTLTPGDIIYTGTPGSTLPMHGGDVVEVEIEGVGTLSNPVVDAA